MKARAPLGRWRWIAFALAATTLLAYAPAFRAPFVLDDWVSIDDASHLEATPGMPTAGRPLAMASLAANFALNRAMGVDQAADPGGPNKTIGYRVFNVLWHLLTGTLLFAVLRRAMRERAIPGEWRDVADPLACVVTALWLLHPIQSEVINYVVQRDEALASLFYLGTLYASMRAWDAAAHARWRWYALGMVSCALGMLSKEVVFTAPLAVMLYDRAFRLPEWASLRRPGEGRGWFYAALWSVCVLVFAAFEAGSRGDPSVLGVTMTWYMYFYTQCWVVVHYLSLVLWPGSLALDYGFRPIHDARGALGFLLLAAMGAATLLAWRRVARFGWLAFAGSMFFILLAPSSSFVPQVLEVGAERRMYLALAAVLVPVIVGLEWCRRRFARGMSARHVTAAVTAVAVALAVATALRSSLYTDPVKLWRQTASAMPANSRAVEQLGLALFTAQPPRYAEAESAFVRALAIDSSCQSGCLQYGTLLTKEGRYADAIPLLERQAGEGSGTKYNLLANRLLALDWMKLGKYDRAIPYLERVVQMDPTLSNFVALGVSYLSEGRRDEAIATFRYMATFDPGNAQLQQLSRRLEEGVSHPEALSNLQEFAFSMTKGWI